ncbi:uncharacterized protein LOC134690422 [Mytilus trossulus]|uniref:uncharacterized protein LOC134690422 n=1 Tax=Mytilus trossulus TaxID=6551 RepID=UPI00300585DF
MLDMAIICKIRILIVSMQIFLLHVSGASLKSNENSNQINESLVIGIFTGIMICMSCYVVTGWIVDIVRKRHVFCKRFSTSDNEYSYADTSRENVRHTDYVDLPTLHSQIRSGNGNDLSNGKTSSDSQYMNMKDTDGVVSTYMEMSGNAGHSENDLYVDIRL